MADWRSSPLSDVVTLQRGYDLPATQRGTGTVPIIGSFGITGYHDHAKYEGPGVAIGRSGASIGVATYCVDDYWPLNTCLFVKDFKGNDPRWTYYLLGSIDFSGFNSGSAQPSLNRNCLANIPVDVPPIEEQRGVVATLGALDDKIESNRRSIEFGLGLLDALAARTANEIPVVVSLREIAVVSRVTTNPAGLGDTPVDHFSIPAFDDAAWPERVAASSIMSSKLLVGQQSILVSRLNPRFNRTWWCVPEADVPALASTEFLVLSAADPEGLGSLWLALRDQFFRDELMRRVTGTSGSHQRIRPEDALNIEVPDVRLLPAERRRQVLDLLAMVHQRRSESRHLARLRDALLPELLSGRIRVPEASEILEATA